MSYEPQGHLQADLTALTRGAGHRSSATHVLLDAAASPATLIAALRVAVTAERLAWQRRAAAMRTARLAGGGAN